MTGASRSTKLNVGEVFGGLTVSGEPESRNGLQWPCVCDCGNPNVIWINISDLRRRGETNGGCQLCYRTRNSHGMGKSNHPTYSKYQAMKQRCSNPKHVAWERYGGRGIKVCARWEASFEDFLSDMGECPGKGYSLDKIDNDGNYEPGNVRWATTSEQRLNMKDNLKLTLNGVERVGLKAICEAAGVNVGIVSRSMYNKGMSIEDAVRSASIDNAPQTV